MPAPVALGPPAKPSTAGSSSPASSIPSRRPLPSFSSDALSSSHDDSSLPSFPSTSLVDGVPSKQPRPKKSRSVSSSSSPSMPSTSVNVPPPPLDVEQLRLSRPPGLSPHHFSSSSSRFPSFSSSVLSGAPDHQHPDADDADNDDQQHHHHHLRRSYPQGAAHQAASRLGGLDVVVVGGGGSDDPEAEGGGGGFAGRRAQRRRAEEEERGGRRGGKAGGLSVLERDSPNAKKSFRSFLLNFTDDERWTIKDELDLHQHFLDTGNPITNVVVQEVCVMKPDMTSLNLTGCTEVTDVGLWAIARHCVNLKVLKLSQCDGITNIGLRSLAMKCTGIEHLDFSRCKALDDHALRVVGAGMWNLRVFILTGCPNITDAGVAEVARCCHKLQVLDVSACEQIGEYGDKALLEVGKYCHDLETLNMFGCKHVQDRGIKAIAGGCPKLRDLQLTGCGELSGKAVKALAAHCPSLTNLSLADCQRIENKDLIQLAKHCKSLTNLDVSSCKNLTAVGLKVLAASCDELVTMNLSSCDRVDDDALKAIADGCVGLRNLNLANCQAITERGITLIAQNCTGIGYLNVTNCKAISRRFLMNLITDMQFSDPAHTYFGYQPKKNADELRRQALILKRKHKACIQVQRIIRGCLARGGVKLIRQAYIIKHQLPKAQAWIRGFLRRKKWKKVLTTRLSNWAATAIQSAWIGMLDRRLVKRLLTVKVVFGNRESMCTHIQRMYRGHKGRGRMQGVRDALARKELAEARERARLERAATIIQRVRRGYSDRIYTDRLQKERERRRALELLRDRSMRKVQRVYRGLLGRIKAKKRRGAKELEELRWRSARTIEAGWRGKLGRDRARAMREYRDYLRCMSAATKIQSAWRGFRGKYMGKIAASLAGLRNLEKKAAVRIQASWRARGGRIKAKSKKLVMAEQMKRMRSMQLIQRLFRGHKGRERFLVAKELKKLEGKAKPLFAKLKTDEVELQVIEEKVSFVAGILKPLQEDTVELEKEIALILRTKAQYWDSARISGAPQRFVTEWLQLRLAEKLKESKDRVEELEDQLAELQIKEREKHRHIRHVKRELVPLTTGVAERTRIDRSKMLRFVVRSQRAASILIQRKFRGHWVRAAFYSPERDTWMEDYDTTTGQNLYFNTWTQETRWRKPLAMKLSEEYDLAAQQARAGVGETLVSAGGWVEMKDQKKGIVYYFNNSTNQYRWSIPDEFSDPKSETTSDWFEAQTDHDMLLATCSSTSRVIGIDWMEMIEQETGETFYANKRTYELRWSLSPRSAFARPAPSQLAAEASLGGSDGSVIEEDIVMGDWRRVSSSSEGVHYVNDRTEEVRWDPPKVFVDAGYS